MSVICASSEASDGSFLDDSKTYCFGCLGTSDYVRAESDLDKCGYTSQELASLRADFQDSQTPTDAIDAGPILRTPDGRSVSHAVVGHSFVCGVRDGEGYCGNTETTFRTVTTQANYQLSMATFQSYLPKCFSSENASLVDSDLLGLELLPDRQLTFPEMMVLPDAIHSYYAYTDILLTNPPGKLFFSEDQNNVGMKGGARMRWREECATITEPQPSARSIYNNGQRPPGNAHRLSGKGSAGHHSACFLTDEPLDTDGQGKHGNVACFGSPHYVYFSASPIMPNPKGWTEGRDGYEFALGHVPIGTFTPPELGLGTRKATKLASSAYAHFAAYEPADGETDGVLVGWGGVREPLGLGITAASELGGGVQMPSFMMGNDGDYWTRDPSRQFILGWTLPGGFGFARYGNVAAKPIVIPYGGGRIIDVYGLHSAVCISVIREDLSDDALLRCWGDWDNLRDAGLLVPGRDTDTPANRAAMADLSLGLAPYIHVGKGYGLTKAELKGDEAGLSVTKIAGAAHSLNEVESLTRFEVQYQSPGAVVVCLGLQGATNAAVGFTGGIRCFQNGEFANDLRPAHGGGHLGSIASPFNTALGFQPATMTENSLYSIQPVPLGRQDFIVHQLEVTNAAACVVYSTDDVSRGLECWGLAETLPYIKPGKELAVMGSTQELAVTDIQPQLPEVVRVGATCNNARLDEEPDPTLEGVPFEVIVTVVGQPATAGMELEEVLSQLSLPETPNAGLAGADDY